MLRVTGLSLLLGLAALVTLLFTVYLPAGMEQPGAASLHWTPTPGDSAEPRVASQKYHPQRITLNKHGAAVVEFPNRGFAAADYAYLHLALRETLPATYIVIVWESSEDEGAPRMHTVETTSRESLWLATGELRGWEADIVSLRLIIAGAADQAIDVREFAVYRPHLAYQLRAIASDLTAYVPWNRSSINTHTGVRRASSFYPAPLFAGLLVTSVAAYLLLCLSLRRVRFQWQVIGLIILGVWIALDMVWQTRLVQQVADTRDTFSGKTTAEKMTVGPDAALYQFIEAAREHIPEARARVFSASSDDYTGLRAAYYFYPHNAFWSLHGDEIPKMHFLRSGDYIALLNPNTVEHDAGTGTLTLPRGTLAVETIVSRPAGTLVRVN